LNTALRFLTLSLTVFLAARAHGTDLQQVQMLDSQGQVAGFVLDEGETFRQGSATLTEKGKARLKDISCFILDTSSSFSIFGFSDNAGRGDTNLILSTVWAQAVRSELLRLGVPTGRMDSVKGLAASEPLASDATPEGRMRNRRVELRFAGRQPLRNLYQAPLPPPAAGKAASGPGVQEPLTAAVMPAQPQRFALGLGYPDLRARLTLGAGVDAEAKFAFEQGIQVYTGRVYWTVAGFGPLKVDVGGEGGYGNFNGVNSLSGGGPVVGGFLGLEYPFAGRLRFSVDAGPFRVRASTEGYAYETTQMVFNTALYIYLL